MKHTELDELLSAYANGELARTQREFIEEHLPTCPDCRSQLSKYVWVRGKVGLLATVPAESSIKVSTMARIEATSLPKGAIHTVGREVALLRRISPRRLPRPAFVATLIAAVIIIPLVLLLVGGGPGAGLAKAYAATNALESFRMAGTSVATANGQINETTFEWEFVAPDRYHGTLESPSGVQEFILVGNDQFIRAAGVNDGFTVIITDGFSVFNPVPTRQGTLQILDSLIEIEELSDGGNEVTHYRGRVDIDRIFEQQLAGVPEGSPDYEASKQLLDMQRSAIIGVDLWIDNRDSTIREMKLDAEFPTIVSDQSGTRSEGTTRYATTVRFLDLNTFISIERPVTASGAVDAGWVKTR